MGWVLAVFANLFFDGITALVDSFLGNRRFSSANAQAFYSCIIGIPLLLLIIASGQVVWPSLGEVGLFFALGALETISLNLYVRAVKVEDTSVCNALYGLSRVFTVILGFIFLGELFTPLTYLGILLIVVSGFFLCLKDPKALTRPPFRLGAFCLSAALIFVACSSFLDACGAVLTRFMVLRSPWVSALFWTRLGSGLTYLLGFLALPGFRREVVAEKSLVPCVWKFFLGNELLSLIAAALAFYAYSQAPAGIVRALFGLSPLFVILIAKVAAPFFPNSWREDLGHVKLRRKLFWIALMILGCYLIMAKE